MEIKQKKPKTETSHKQQTRQKYQQKPEKQTQKKHK